MAKLSSEQLKQTTASLYAETNPTFPLSDIRNHFGPYKNVRAGLDWKYHQLPTKERQMLQDSIVESFLKKPTNSSDIQRSNEDDSNSNKNPRALFTAGGMGAGKGHTLRHFLKKGDIKLGDGFVWVDPDKIARLLPERAQYLENDSLKASELLHPEAALLQEIVAGAATEQRRSLVIDGSLSCCEYFAKLMKQYRGLGYDMEILFVFADEEIMFKRAERRAEETGRRTPRSAIKSSREKSPKCVQTLAKKEHVHRIRLVNNTRDDIPPQVVYDSNLDSEWCESENCGHLDVHKFAIDGAVQKDLK